MNTVIILKTKVGAMRAWLFLIIICFAPQIAAAEQADPVRNRFFTNDHLGDGHDRWRSASYSLYWSFDRAPDWLLSPWLSQRPIDLYLRAEIISPWGVQAQTYDRAYAGILGFGATVHSQWRDFELDYGGELVVLGPQTRLSHLQAGLHEHLGLNGYDFDAQKPREIENDINGALYAELARKFPLGEVVKVRPFLMAQIGIENYLRLGFDLLWGDLAQGGRFVRDGVTGFVARADQGRAQGARGASVVFGLDYTALNQSDLFPTDYGARVKKDRFRARLGFEKDWGAVSSFYGLTYLSREFKTQAEAQVLGTVSFAWQF